MSPADAWVEIAFWIGAAGDPKEPAFVLRCRTARQAYAVLGLLRAALGPDADISMGRWEG